MVQVFDSVTSNPGAGGVVWTADTFTDDSVSKTIPYEALAFGPINGPYAPVTTSAGLPANIVQWGGTAPTAATALAESIANPTSPLVGSCAMLWNGATWDRQVNVLSGPLLTSAARTTFTQASAVATRGCKGVTCYLSVTAASGTGGLNVNILAIDPVSGNGPVVNVPFAAAIKTTGIFGFQVYPGATATATSTMVYTSAVLMASLFIAQVTVGDASSYTYSLGYVLIP